MKLRETRERAQGLDGQIAVEVAFDVREHAA
jgi:hypothetical protein